MLWLVNIYGHWPGEGPAGRLQRLLSYTVVVWTVALLLAESVSTKDYFHQGDLQTGLINLNEMVYGAQCTVIVLAFIIYKPQMERAINKVDDVTERVLEESGDDWTTQEEVKRRKKRCLWAHRVFFWSFILICHWALTPVLHLWVYGETTVIVHSWLPFDNRAISGFYANFLLQVVPCTSFCVCFCMFGSVYVCLSELILGHMKILRHRLKNVRYGQSNTRQELNKCIKHHQDILQIVQIFQHFTSIPLIAFCLLTVVVLCVILFELTTVENTTNERAINLIEEAQQLFFFLTTYCWYANEITYQCRELLVPGYLADWYNGTISEKKTLLIIMTRPLLSGYFGGFVRIDLLTIVNVSKATFSYFNFLGAVNADQNEVNEDI